MSDLNLMSYLFLLLAGIAKGIMDLINFKFEISIFYKWKWFDTKNSWVNKWKNGDPEQGEAFPLSSTMLVFVTDGWHMIQLIFIKCIMLAVLFHEIPSTINSIIIDTLFLSTFYVGFWLSYESKFLRKS